MKTILVAVEEGPELASVLDTALLVARRYGSYVEGFPVNAYTGRVWEAQTAADEEMPPDLWHKLAEQDRERGRRAEELFRRHMAERGLSPHAVETNDGLTVGWRATEAAGAQVVGERGRLFDLIVFPGPPLRKGVMNRRMLEAALFESGRLLLIAPPETPKSLGETIVIAWNSSTETARSVAFSLPLIRKASRVVALSVEGGNVAGPSVYEFADLMGRRHIPVEPRSVAPGNKSVGETILAETRALGADLLIKGAYTRSRLRQYVFGGPTQHILTAADLPVVMAH